jgi:hypothetical protein
MQKMLDKQIQKARKDRSNESENQLTSWAIDELQKIARTYIAARDNTALLYQVFINEEITGMEE